MSLYRPGLALLPIGDHYTMGPLHAARACRMLGVRHVVPMHFGTFPALTQSADSFVDAAGDIDGLGGSRAQAGRGVDSMSESIDARPREIKRRG